MEILYGICSGIITALGMGGGTILILFLNLCTDLNEHVIQGINLITFIPTAIVACFINNKRKLIDFKISKTIIFYGIIGAIFGSIVSFKFESYKLKKFFGVFLILIGIYEIYKLSLKYKRKNKKNTIIEKK